MPKIHGHKARFSLNSTSGFSLVNLEIHALLRMAALTDVLLLDSCLEHVGGLTAAHADLNSCDAGIEITGSSLTDTGRALSSNIFC